GLDHKVIAAGVDEQKNRLVVVSGEADASGAALAQADIQASINDVKVIVSRPAIFDVSAVGRAFEQRTGKTAVSSEDLEVLTTSTARTLSPDAEEFLDEVLGPLAEQIRQARAVGSIGFVQGLEQLIAQLGKADWSQVIADDADSPSVDFSGL